MPTTHHIRDWRRFRRLTLRQVGDATGLQPSCLSRIETGVQPYTEPQLLVIALALGCHAADLVSRKPATDQDLELMVRLLDEDKRRELRPYLHLLLTGKPWPPTDEN